MSGLTGTTLKIFREKGVQPNISIQILATINQLSKRQEREKNWLKMLKVIEPCKNQKEVIRAFEDHYQVKLKMDWTTNDIPKEI